MRKSVFFFLQYDKIGDNYALSANSTKNMLIMVFLHAEFISTMKTVQNLTIFVKMQNNRNMNNFGNFCEFFVIFTETLEQNIRKSQEMCFF